MNVTLGPSECSFGDASPLPGFDFIRNLAERNARLLQIGGAQHTAVAIDYLGANIRDFKAQTEVWKMVFPEDKKKVEQVEEYVKKFDKAQDMDDFDIILESIRQSIKAKSKPFTPDSSKTESSKGQRGLSGDAALLAGLEKERKEMGR